MKKLRCSLIALLFISIQAIGQIPNGYYNSAEGKTGAELKVALFDIIKIHTPLTYTALWTAFQFTDKKPNGKVWDMYSDKPGQTPPYEYTFITNQCGNYSGEGSCYNREHSVPASWFNDGTPMYSDLFHLYPTDGYVNNRRGNYPFGRVGSATWTSLNGSKLGTSSSPGYTGIVFEPIDEYKGDFARTYFYMATRYHNVVQNWSSPMLANNQFPAFTGWAINMLLEWHRNDPVSQKELDRNNKIYSSYQYNRNPFIDRPEFAQLVWDPGALTVSFSSLPGASAIAGGNYYYNIVATGPGIVTISCPEKPAWLTFTPTGNGTASLGGTPNASHEGVHSVQLVASNGTQQANQNFNITVSVVNAAPVIASFTHSPQSPFNFQTMTVLAEVTNDDGVPYVSCLWGLGATQLTNEIAMPGSGGNFWCTFPVPADCTQVHYQVKATDGGGLTAHSAISSVTIQPNAAPVIYSIDFWPQNPTPMETVLVRALAADDNNDELAVSVLWGFSPIDLLNNAEMLNQGGFFQGAIPQNASPATIYFKVVVSDGKGGTAQGALHSYAVTTGAGITELSNNILSIFPNPARGLLNVMVGYAGSSRYQITDISGRIVQHGELDHHSTSGTINLNGVANGMYFLRVTSLGPSGVVRFVVGQ